MNQKSKKAFYLIIFIIITLFIVCLGIPLIHDFLFDSYSVSNYEVREGIVSNVILKDNKGGGTCENIVVDNYEIFIKCGDDYTGQFEKGDRTSYYVYKDKGYYTEDQMKSGSFIGKILDYGMICTYILLFCLIILKKDKLSAYIDEMAGNKN